MYYLQLDAKVSFSQRLKLLTKNCIILFSFSRKSSKNQNSGKLIFALILRLVNFSHLSLQLQIVNKNFQQISPKSNQQSFSFPAVAVRLSRHHLSLKPQLFFAIKIYFRRRKSTRIFIEYTQQIFFSASSKTKCLSPYRNVCYT